MEGFLNPNMAHVYLFRKSKTLKNIRIVKLFAWTPVKITNYGWTWLRHYYAFQVYEPNGKYLWKVDRTALRVEFR